MTECDIDVIMWILLEGGSLLGPGNRMGDSMAASSSYDVYPESGDFEVFFSLLLHRLYVCLSVTLVH